MVGGGNINYGEFVRDYFQFSGEKERVELRISPLKKEQERARKSRLVHVVGTSR